MWERKESGIGQFGLPAQTTSRGQSSARVHQRDGTSLPAEKRIKHILVATDFSASSAGAIERAVGIANQCGADLTILHVVDINAQVEAEECGTFMRRIWDEGSSQMGQLAWSLSGQVEARTMIEQGLPWEAIVERSREFDLVILGKSSAKTRNRLFSKHTAQRVIEGAACPVMVVPDRI
jgi:nucleotide-binding universal stress UspA family protein